MKFIFSILVASASIGLAFANPTTGNVDPTSKCVEQQRIGYDWTKAPRDITNYGGSIFTGWVVDQKLQNPEYPVSGYRGGAMIVGIREKKPSIKAGKDIGTFSIKSYELHAAVTGRVIFTYRMADNSICTDERQFKQLTTEIITNTKCLGPTLAVEITGDCFSKIHEILFHCPKCRTEEQECHGGCIPGAQTCPKCRPGQQKCHGDCIPGAQVCSSTTPQPSSTSTTPKPSSTSAPSKPSSTSALSKPSSTSAPSKPSSTSATPKPSSTSAPPKPSSTSALSKPSSTSAPSKPSSTSATPKPSSTSAPSKPSSTSAPSKPSSTSAPSKPSSKSTIPKPSSTSTPPAVKTTSSTVMKQSSNSMTASTMSSKRVTTATNTTITVTSTYSRTLTTDPPPAPTTDEGLIPTSAPAVPNEDLHCPTVLPRCLDNLLPLITKCKDNTDYSCYCPDRQFVEALYNCIASDATDGTISNQAVMCFQGDCAPYIPENPVIATGTETYTEFINMPATAIQTLASTKYATATVDTTIVGSSTAKTFTTQVVVPIVTSDRQLPTTQPSDPAPIVNNSGPIVVGNPPNVTFARPSGSANPPVTAGAPGIQVSLALGIAVLATLAAW